MAKKLDEATKLLIDSLPESLKELALSATEIGYLSQMDFNAAIEADEVPEDERDEVLEFFKQDLELEVIETDGDKFARDMFCGECPVHGMLLVITGCRGPQL